MINKISFQQKLKIKIKIINALIYRELITRISKNGLGVLGIFGESLFSILIFVILFSIIRRNTIGGLDIYIFLICGIVTFNLFNSITIRSSNGIEANKSLISSFKNLKPIDAVLSRGILELFLYFLLFSLLIVLVFIFKEISTLNNINLIFLSFLNVFILSLGYGIFLMIICHKFEFIKILLTGLSRPIFLTSGIFFQVNSLPQLIKPFVVWNPLVHIIEKLRLAFSNDYIIDETLSYSYSFKFSLIFLLLSLTLYSLYEKELR